MVSVGELKPSGGTSQFAGHQHLITKDPNVRNGEPCIRGLPIAVSDIRDYFAAGLTPEQIIAKHPELTFEDIMACLVFIANQVFPQK